MIRKDYIQRYFDELAKVLAAVLQFKNKHEPVEAENQLNEFSSNYLGISIYEILNIETPELINTLIHKYNFTVTHFKLLEELLYNFYLLHKSNQQLKNSTLEILKYLTEIDTDFSVERKNRIEELAV